MEIFCSGGTATVIPTAVQPDGSVSFTTGYGPAYEADISTDPNARAIERAKMNWLFKKITEEITDIGGRSQFDLGTAALTGTNYNASVSPSAIPSLFYVKFASANPASSTLTVTAGGVPTVMSLRSLDNVALPAGVIAAGNEVGIMWDGATARVVNSRLATAAETGVGAAAGVAISVAGLFDSLDPSGVSNNLKTRLDSLTKASFNAAGSAPLYACRAMINANGTGTVSIRKSGNVLGFADNGTGTYTVTFITAALDADYIVSGTASFDSGGGSPSVLSSDAATVRTTSAYQFKVRTGNSNTLVDSSIINLTFHW